MPTHAHTRTHTHTHAHTHTHTHPNTWPFLPIPCGHRWLIQGKIKFPLKIRDSGHKNIAMGNVWAKAYQWESFSCQAHVGFLLFVSQTSLCSMCTLSLLWVESYSAHNSHPPEKMFGSSNPQWLYLEIGSVFCLLVLGNFFFREILVFELMASHKLGRHSTWVTPPVLSVLVILDIWSQARLPEPWLSCFTLPAIAGVTGVPPHTVLFHRDGVSQFLGGVWLASKP
jgi:hypothetical protein